MFEPKPAAARAGALTRVLAAAREDATLVAASDVALSCAHGGPQARQLPSRNRTALCSSRQIASAVSVGSMPLPP